MHVATQQAISILKQHCSVTNIECSEPRAVYNALRTEYDSFNDHCADMYYSGCLGEEDDILHSRMGQVLGRLARVILDTEESA